MPYSPGPQTVAAGEGPVGRFSVSDVFTDMFGYLKSLGTSLALIGIFAFLPIVVMAYWIPSTAFIVTGDETDMTASGMWGSIVASMTMASLGYGVMYEGIFALSRGEKVSSLTMALRVVPKFLPLLLTSVYVTVLGAIGLVLLVVPGVMVWVALSVCGQAVVAEGLGHIDALKRSLVLTHGFRWPIFGAMIVFGILNGLFSFLTELIAPYVTPLFGSHEASATVAFNTLVTGITYAAGGAFSGALFLQLREAKEGKPADKIAEVFA